MTKLFQLRDADLGQPDQHHRVAVEVWAGEVDAGIVGNQRELDPFVGNPRSEDVAVGCVVSQGSVVGLAQRGAPKTISFLRTRQSRGDASLVSGSSPTMRATSSQVATETIVPDIFPGRFAPAHRPILSDRAALAGDRSRRTAGSGHRRLASRGGRRERAAVSGGRTLEPPGDEITADIARESANDVIKELKALDVQHRGAITLDGP